MPPGNIEKLGFAWRHALRNPLPLPSGVQCGEQLANSGEIYVLEQLKTNKKDVEIQLKAPVQEEYVWATLHNPKVAIYLFTQMMLIFGVISIGTIILLFLVILLFNPDKLKDISFVVTGLCFPSACILFHVIGKTFLKSDKRENKNNILFNRRKGKVTIPRKNKEPLEFPFDEFDPYMGTSVNPSGSVDYHLILAHRYTGSFVQDPSSSREEVNVYFQWEFLQQYMDISKPLPDVPSMEPFRSKDPVTAGYDRKHDRPPRYWRNMDIEQARRMKEASVKAASNFPWGLTRDQALAQGWQPSGFGEGDWKKG
jgi:hypothetical protein